MAIQTILNGINIISVDDTKYVINDYGNVLNVCVEIVDKRSANPFVVCRMYAGLTHWYITPPSNKFNKAKNTGIEITLD